MKNLTNTIQTRLSNIITWSFGWIIDKKVQALGHHVVFIPRRIEVEESAEVVVDVRPRNIVLGEGDEIGKCLERRGHCIQTLGGGMGRDVDRNRRLATANIF